jgi:hypothetical protein
MMSKKFWLGMTLVILVSGLFLLSGCGDKKAEKQKVGDDFKMVVKDSKGQEVNVNMQQGKIEIEGKSGKSQIMDSSVWPSDMFPDVPQFAFGQVKHVQKHQHEDGLMNFVVLHANVEADAMNKYADLLKKNGWKISLTMMSDKNAMIGAKKGKLAISLTYTADTKEAALIAHNSK